MTKNQIVESFAGLSLGEFAALALNGVILEKDLLPLIEDRIEAMNMSLKGEPGMIALIGADIKLIEKMVVDLDKVYIANYNSHKQIVCAGNKSEIAKLKLKLKDEGIKRVIDLNVKGAFHTPYMESSAPVFAKALEKYNFDTSNIKTYSNVTAQLHTEESLKEDLVKHLYSPVLFYQIIEKIPVEQKIIEVGPGKTLAKLVKETSNIQAKSVYDLATLESELI